MRQLRKGQESSTFERLSDSRHVADLRLIFSVTVIIMIAASILALAFCFELRVMTTWTEIQSSHSGWIWARLALSSIADSGVFIGAIGAVGCVCLPGPIRPAAPSRGGRLVRLRDCKPSAGWPP